MSQSKTRVQIAGRIVELTAKNGQLLRDVSSVFPPIEHGIGDRFDDTRRAGLLIDLEDLASTEQTEPTEKNAPFLVAPLITKVLHEIEGYVWIDATALVINGGRLCLIAGASGTGKTTLTLALALKHACRIVCEDITLIDSQRKKVLPLAIPLHLRPGTERRVMDVVDFEAASFLRLGGWAFRADLYYTQPLDATFSTAICFLPPGNGIFGQLEARRISSAEFLRALLPISNALRTPGGPDFLNKILADTTCMKIEGGTLEERVQVFLSCCAGE